MLPYFGNYLYDPVNRWFIPRYGFELELYCLERGRSSSSKFCCTMFCFFFPVRWLSEPSTSYNITRGFPFFGSSIWNDWGFGWSLNFYRSLKYRTLLLLIFTFYFLISFIFTLSVFKFTLFLLNSCFMSLMFFPCHCSIQREHVFLVRYGALGHVESFSYCLHMSKYAGYLPLVYLGHSVVLFTLSCTSVSATFSFVISNNISYMLWFMAFFVDFALLASSVRVCFSFFGQKGLNVSSEDAWAVFLDAVFSSFSPSSLLVFCIYFLFRIYWMLNFVYFWQAWPSRSSLERFIDITTYWFPVYLLTNLPIYWFTDFADLAS